MNQFKFDSLKEDFIVCRAFAKICLSKYLQKKANEISFSYSAKDKPFLKQFPDLQFNISHSYRKCILGITAFSPIGVDIEYHKKDIDLKQLASQFFSGFENAQIQKLNGEDLIQGFYRCWTQKESFIKATGDGLSFPLDLFSVNFQKDQAAELLKTKWEKDEVYNWSLYNLDIGKDYSGAVAVRSPRKELHYMQ